MRARTHSPIHPHSCTHARTRTHTHMEAVPSQLRAGGLRDGCVKTSCDINTESAFTGKTDKVTAANRRKAGKVSLGEGGREAGEWADRQDGGTLSWARRVRVI